MTTVVAWLGHLLMLCARHDQGLRPWEMFNISRRFSGERLYHQTEMHTLQVKREMGGEEREGER